MTDSIPLPDAAQRMVDAINAADTDAFVDAFAPDGFVDDWGRVLRGPDGVRSWAASDAIGAGARMTILSADVDGDTVTTRFEWRSRVFTGESTVSSRSPANASPDSGSRRTPEASQAQ